MKTRWTNPLCFKENHSSKFNPPPPPKKKPNPKHPKQNQPTHHQWTNPWLKMMGNNGWPWSTTRFCPLDALRTSTGTSSLDWTDFSGNSSIVLAPHVSQLYWCLYLLRFHEVSSKDSTKCVTFHASVQIFFGRCVHCVSISLLMTRSVSRRVIIFVAGGA